MMGQIRFALGCALAVSFVLAAAADAPAQRPRVLKEVYAPPAVFGPWTNIINHAGPATFTIEVVPLGDTLVYGEVEYCITRVERRERGTFTEVKTVTAPFVGSVTIQVGNCVAPVRVRLKGVPFGSACRATVR